MFNLSGKQALVTGAASGIGRSTAEALATAGAHVYVSDVNDDAGNAVVEHIASTGGKASFLHLDVSLKADSVAARDVVNAAGSPLHILVNNAGIGKVGTILETEE